MVFESSHMDLWMDVTNFTAIDGVYGKMQDFEDLLAAVHVKGGTRLSLTEAQGWGKSFTRGLFNAPNCSQGNTVWGWVLLLLGEAWCIKDNR